MVGISFIAFIMDGVQLTQVLVRMRLDHISDFHFIHLMGRSEYFPIHIESIYKIKGCEIYKPNECDCCAPIRYSDPAIHLIPNNTTLVPEALHCLHIFS